MCPVWASTGEEPNPELEHQTCSLCQPSPAEMGFKLHRAGQGFVGPDFTGAQLPSGCIKEVLSAAGVTLWEPEILAFNCSAWPVLTLPQGFKESL